MYDAEGLTAETAALLAKHSAVMYVEKEGIEHVTDMQSLPSASQWDLIGWTSTLRRSMDNTLLPITALVSISTSSIPA